MDIFRQAFINQFSPLLETSGYRLLNIEQPVYVKAVGREIMHIVMYTYADGKYLGDDQKALFIIQGGIATVYKKNITESTFSENTSWMRGMRFFCEKNPDCFFEDVSFFDSVQEHTFLKNNASSLDDSLHYACELTEEFILPELEKIQTLRNCINFFEKFRLYIFDQRKMKIYYNYKDNYDEENVYIRLRDMEFAKRQKELQSRLDPSLDSYQYLEKLYTAITNDDAYKKALKKMNNLKEKNITILKKLGVEFVLE